MPVKEKLHCYGFNEEAVKELTDMVITEVNKSRTDFQIPTLLSQTKFSIDDDKTVYYKESLERKITFLEERLSLLERKMNPYLLQIYSMDYLKEMIKKCTKKIAK